mmetsp:Transcript_2552/g.5940  ORF Transcript_2552/g.5940 Transcript_2552/m.5940 type:complete len:221 (-) Transcript_2552:630-1292(-)
MQDTLRRLSPRCCPWHTKCAKKNTGCVATTSSAGTDSGKSNMDSSADCCESLQPRSSSPLYLARVTGRPQRARPLRRRRQSLQQACLTLATMRADHGFCGCRARHDTDHRLGANHRTDEHLGELLEQLQQTHAAALQEGAGARGQPVAQSKSGLLFLVRCPDEMMNCSQNSSHLGNIFGGHVAFLDLLHKLTTSPNNGFFSSLRNSAQTGHRVLHGNSWQ